MVSLITDCLVLDLFIKGKQGKEKGKASSNFTLKFLLCVVISHQHFRNALLDICHLPGSYCCGV